MFVTLGNDLSATLTTSYKHESDKEIKQSLFVPTATSILNISMNLCESNELPILLILPFILKRYILDTPFFVM